MKNLSKNFILWGVIPPIEYGSYLTTVAHQDAPQKTFVKKKKRRELVKACMLTLSGCVQVVMILTKYIKWWRDHIGKRMPHTVHDVGGMMRGAQYTSSSIQGKL